MIVGPSYPFVLRMVTRMQGSNPVAVFMPGSGSSFLVSLGLDSLKIVY